MTKVRISRSKSGKIRIKQEDGNAITFVLFESLGSSILESRFDQDGSITNQRLLKGSSVDLVAKEFTDTINSSEMLDEEYSEIKLQKSCPHCSMRPLTRYMDTLMYPKEAPVMPLYVCDSCKRRSYYLTDEYLKNLVTTNKALFKPSEISQMDKDERAFMDELRAYIIRIFASKSIIQIK